MSRRRPFILITLLILTVGIALAVWQVPRLEAVQAFWADRQHDRVLADYTDKTVIATLEALVESIERLDGAAERLAADPSQAHLDTAAAAWRPARRLWQETLAFQYGPAAHYNFDKQLAAWPVDRVRVDHTLAGMAAGRLELDPARLRDRRATQRGLLTAEYLLFRDGAPRALTGMGDAERRYLAAVTGALRLEGSAFLAQWAGTANLAPERAAALEEAGFESHTAYGDELRNPGAPDSRYASASVSLQDILGDTLAATEQGLCPRIAETLDTTDRWGSQTRLSRHGLADLQGTLQGVANSYLGGRPGDRGRSIAELMASYNAVVDRRIKIALGQVAHRLEALAGPDGVADAEPNGLPARRAVAACETLRERIGVATLIVTMHPRAKPWMAYGVEEAEPLRPGGMK
jgi:hypothetical protein